MFINHHNIKTKVMVKNLWKLISVCLILRKLQVEMNPAKQDFILEKHVFKMMEIETASACEVNCFMEADCVSYNLKPQQNGKLLCELSDSDHTNNQQDLRYKKGTVYKSFKVS